MGPYSPGVGRRRELYIIRRNHAGITALALANANNLADTFQCFITKEMDNIVPQTNREARRRIGAWNKNNQRELRGEWKPVDGVEVTK